MAEARRGPREDAAASHKGGIADSQGVVDMGKVKQNNMFVPQKFDGYGGSLVTDNLHEAKFGFTAEGGITEGSSYMPPQFVSNLNVNSELQDLSFLNLTEVSLAEQVIIQSIIDSKWYSDSLFSLMRPGGNVEEESSDRCLTETEGNIECDGIPEVSAAGDSDGGGGPGHMSDEVSHLQNGPIVELSQQHINPVDEESMQGVMTTGVPPSNMRTYYPNQHHITASTTGPVPTSVQLPVSGGQVMMYTQQIPQQLMQPGHGGYPMPVNYSQLHYGFPQHGGQPHVTYVSPTGGDALNHEPVHMGPPPQQTHQKSHHEGHHGMVHTSTNSGPGSYSKGRNARRDNKQQQQQQQHQPYYYHTSYPSYAPGMHFQNHQQLAQNVTGSPIIMQPPPHGGMYPYHHQHPQTMYPPNTVPGDMEHHQPNVGMPQQMTHISGDLPPYAQQHHIAPQMYHHSPTHSGTNRNTSYSQQQAPRGGNVPPSIPLEQPINPSAPNSSDIHSETGEAFPVDEVKTSDGYISQPSGIPVADHHNSPAGDRGEIVSKKESEYISQQNQKKSYIPGTPSQGIHTQVASSTGGPQDMTSHQQQGHLVIRENNFESLSEPSRDTELDNDRIAPPHQVEQISSTKNATGGRVNRNNSQPKSTSSDAIENKETVINYKDSPSVNGEVKDIKPGRGGAPRDKISAEPVSVIDATTKKDYNETNVARQSGSASGRPTDTKSNVSANVNSSSSSRSVNVVSNTSVVTAASINTISVTKDINERIGQSSPSVDASATGDFPQLSSNCNSVSPPSSNSVITSSSTVNSTSISSTTPASTTSSSAVARGRSWASIASVKSQSDGANSRRVPGASNQVGDQGNADTISGGGRLAGGEQYNCVPIIHKDKCLAKSLGESDYVTDESGMISDENDPVALALGEFLRNYNLDHHSIALTPRGLYNQSNYCYINATLQSLLACPPFVNMFRAMGDILNKRQCRATPIIQSVFELVSEFEPLLRGGVHKKDRNKDIFHVGANLEPLGIRKCLGLLEGNTFKVEGRQEDAEEFLSHLLNGLHDEMLKVMKLAEHHKERSISGRNKPHAGNNPMTNKLAATAAADQGATNGGGIEISGDEDDDQWQVMGAKNKSCLTRKTTVSKTPISEAFLGQMCYFYKGSNKSATHQPFYTLQLDIQNDNIRSVRDALEAVVAKEEVSGVVSPNGAEVEAWRQLTLEELPVVLILHLKRFVYEQKSNMIKKIDKKLDFGIDLEIFREMLSPTAKNKYTSRQRQYKLFGVVYHDGEETHKGHYIADCFHASGGSMWGQCGWLRFDDTSVKQIPESQMLNPLPPRVPYLLYYRRADTLLSHVSQQPHKKERP